jgi:anthranilate synthase
VTVPFPETYQTRAGVRVRRVIEDIDGVRAIDQLASDLDTRRGVLLTSSYEYPGRYTRWDLGFVDPPLSLTARERELWVEALNARGEVLLPVFERALRATTGVCDVTVSDGVVRARIEPASGSFSEEQRTRLPSVFSVLRTLIETFNSPHDTHLGMYGAFGYDLTFQFDPVKRSRLVLAGRAPGGRSHARQRRARALRLRGRWTLDGGPRTHRPTRGVRVCRQARA